MAAVYLPEQAPIALPPLDLPLPPAEPPTLRLVRIPQVTRPEPEHPLAGVVAEAEARIERHAYREAAELLAPHRLGHDTPPELALRALFARSWSLMYLGDLGEAVELLERASVLANARPCTEIDVAETLYRLGCCRFLLASTAEAISLFTVALTSCDRPGLECDRLCAHILEWRSRCYQRQRDWSAARADVERALELAERAGDRLTVAHVYFQASLIAEHERQWLLARFYAEEAKQIYEQAGDWLDVGKVLNNLGGLHFLLGEGDRARAALEEAYRVLVEHGGEAEAAYAVSSLAQVHLRSGEPAAAEELAMRAIAVLEGRLDHVEELGNVRLVLGRSLLEQGRLEDAEEACAAAEASFERLSAGCRAAALVARGDVVRRRGELERAADLYRRAADLLQDFHF